MGDASCTNKERRVFLRVVEESAMKRGAIRAPMLVRGEPCMQTYQPTASAYERNYGVFVLFRRLQRVGLIGCDAPLTGNNERTIG